MKQKYAEELVSRGIIKIGTLYEYRNEELHGEEVGDSDEGTKKINYRIKDEYWGGPFKQPEFTKDVFKLEQGASIHMQNVTIAKEVRSPDMYIYSSSGNCVEDVMVKLGYDTCVRMVNPEAFFLVISSSMRLKGKYLGSYPCAYGFRDEDYHEMSNIHPCITKPMSYAYQSEYRSIWQPRGSKKEIKPIVLSNKLLTKHCEICEPITQ